MWAGRGLPEGYRSMTGRSSSWSVALPPLRVKRTMWYFPSLTNLELSSMLMSSVPTLNTTLMLPLSWGGRWKMRCNDRNCSVRIISLLCHQKKQYLAFLAPTSQVRGEFKNVKQTRSSDTRGRACAWNFIWLMCFGLWPSSVIVALKTFLMLSKLQFIVLVSQRLIFPPMCLNVKRNRTCLFIWLRLHVCCTSAKMLIICLRVVPWSCVGGAIRSYIQYLFTCLVFQ